MIQMHSDEFDLKDSGLVYIDAKDGFPEEELSKRRGTMAYVETEENILYGGFVQNIKGKDYIFPVPDPTLIYFNSAQGNIALIEERKKALIEKVDFRIKLSEPALNEIYHFYGATSGFIIFLFTSIESFVNQQIPNDFEFKKELRNKTEIYNKNQIQSSIDFKTKLKEVLPLATGISFFNKTTPTNERIWKLKEFRDEIVHTKPGQSDLQYEDLIKKSLKFKYVDTLHAVAKFMNAHKPDYIVECDCGQDF